MSRRDRRSAWARFVAGSAFAGALAWFLAWVVVSSVQALGDLLILLASRA